MLASLDFTKMWREGGASVLIILALLPLALSVLVSFDQGAPDAWENQVKGVEVQYRTVNVSSLSGSSSPQLCLDVRWSSASRYPFQEAADAVRGDVPSGIAGFAAVHNRSRVLAAGSGDLLICAGVSPQDVRLHARLLSPTLVESLSPIGLALQPERMPPSGAAAASGSSAVEYARWLPFSSSASSLIALPGLSGALAWPAASGARSGIVHWGTDPLALTNGLWPPKRMWMNDDSEHGGFILQSGGIALWPGRGSYPFLSNTDFSHRLVGVPLPLPALEVRCAASGYCGTALTSGYLLVGGKVYGTAAVLAAGTLPVLADAGYLDVTVINSYVPYRLQRRNGLLTVVDIVERPIVSNVTAFGCGVENCCARNSTSQGFSTYCWGKRMDVATGYTTDVSPNAPALIPGAPTNNSIFRGTAAAIFTLLPQQAVNSAVVQSAEWPFPPSSVVGWGKQWDNIGRPSTVSGNPAQVPVGLGVLDLQCTSSLCFAIADSGLTLFVWGKRLVRGASELSIDAGAAPVRLAGADGILSKLSKMPGNKRLQCSQYMCCIASVLGMHCFGYNHKRYLVSSEDAGFIVDPERPRMVESRGVTKMSAIIPDDLPLGMEVRAIINGSFVTRGADVRDALGWGDRFASRGWFATPLPATEPIADSVEIPGYSSAILTASGSVWAILSVAGWQPLTLALPATTLFAGTAGWKSCWAGAVLQDGSVYVAGSVPAFFTGANDTSLLDVPLTAPRRILQDLSVSTPVASVCTIRASADSGFICALLRNGSVACGGRNSKASFPAGFGFGAFDGYQPITVIPRIGNASALKCGGALVCVILSNGTVICVGAVNYGFVGNSMPYPSAPGTYYLPVPTLMAMPEAIVELSLGWLLFGAIGRSGKMYTWGSPAVPWARPTPTAAQTDVVFANITCGQLNCIAVARNGSAWLVGMHLHLLMLDDPPGMEPSLAFNPAAFRSGPSLLRSLPLERFGPTRLTSAAAAFLSSNVLHHCAAAHPLRSLIDDPRTRRQSERNAADSSRDLRAAFMCAANATAVACWGALPFLGAVYDTVWEREGAGADASEIDASFTRPLLPAVVPSFTTGASIASLHCSPGGIVVSYRADGSIVRLAAGSCALDLRLATLASASAGMQLIPMAAEPSAPLLLLHLSVASPRSTEWSTIALQNVSLLAALVSNASVSCSWERSLELPLTSPAGKASLAAQFWRVTVVYVIRQGAWPWRICASATFRLDGNSGVWCGQAPLAEDVHNNGDDDIAPPLASSPSGIFPSTVVQLAFSDWFGLCALLADGALYCQRDATLTGSASSPSTPTAWPRLHSSVSAVAASTAHLCIITMAMGVQCLGNNTRGEAGFYGKRWANDTLPWISRSDIADVPGLSPVPAGLNAAGEVIEQLIPPPPKPRWDTAVVIASSCFGAASYSPSTFSLNGCVLSESDSSMLWVNFTGGGPFPAGTVMHAHWSAVPGAAADPQAPALDYSSAPLRCSYARTVPLGLPHWCFFSLPLPNASAVRSAMFHSAFRLTLHVSYSLANASNPSPSAGLNFRTCDPAARADSREMPGCFDAATDAPSIFIIRASSLTASTASLQWNASARTLQAVSAIVPTRLRVATDLDLPLQDANDATSVLVRAAVQLSCPTSPTQPGSSPAGISTSDCGDGKRWVNCTDVVRTADGKGFECTIPPLLGSGHKLIAEVCWDCAVDSGAAAQNDTAVETWSLLLAGSELIETQTATFVSSVLQPVSALPSAGIQPAAGNTTLRGTFTSLAARARVVWQLAEPCSGVSTVEQWTDDVTPTAVVLPVLPGYSVHSLQLLELNGWAVPLTGCGGSAAARLCNLTYAAPALSAVSATFNASDGAYAVKLTGSGLGSLSCTPLHINIDGKPSGDAVADGDDATAVFRWAGSLQPTSQVQVIGAGGLLRSRIISDVVIDPGCAPFTLCGIGLSQYIDGVVTLSAWQEAVSIAGVTPAGVLVGSMATAPAALTVWKRSGVALWPPLRVAAVHVPSAATGANVPAAVPRPGSPAAVAASMVIVPESRTICTTAIVGESGSNAARASVIFAAAAVEDGNELPLPSGIDAVARSKAIRMPNWRQQDGVAIQLSVQCSRDGALQLQLPNVTVIVAPLELSAEGGAHPQPTGGSNISVAPHAVVSSGVAVTPPIAVAFPAPMAMVAALLANGNASAGLEAAAMPLPLTTAPCAFAVAVEQPIGPTLDTMTAVADADFASNGSTGVFVASRLSVRAVPGTRMRLRVSCTSSGADSSASSSAPSASFNLAVAPCEPGSIVQQPGLTCQRCSNGSVSLFPLPDTDPLHTCVRCSGFASGSFAVAAATSAASAPETATDRLPAIGQLRGAAVSSLTTSGLQCAFGGSAASALPGYWRPTNASLVALPCTPAEACDESVTGPGTCMPGYQGRLCSRCAEGWGRSGPGCIRCPEIGSAGSVIAVLLLLFVLTMVVVCWARLSTVAHVSQQLDKKSQPRARVQKDTAASTASLVGTGDSARMNPLLAAAAASSSPSAAHAAASATPSGLELRTASKRSQAGAGGNAATTVAAAAATAGNLSSSAATPAAKATDASSALTRVIAAPRLLVDHSQALQVAASLDLVWPPAVAALLASLSIASSATSAEFIMPYECVVRAMTPAHMKPLRSLFLATQTLLLLLPMLLLAMAYGSLALWPVCTNVWTTVSASRKLCCRSWCRCRRNSPFESHQSAAAGGAASSRQCTALCFRLANITTRAVAAAKDACANFGPATGPPASAQAGAAAPATSDGTDAICAIASPSRRRFKQSPLTSGAPRLAARGQSSLTLWVLWWLESAAAATIAILYLMHALMTQRLAAMLACSSVTDIRIIPLTASSISSSAAATVLTDAAAAIVLEQHRLLMQATTGLAGGSKALAAAVQSHQSALAAHLEAADPALQLPSWPNITSLRITGGAWLVSEKASYALGDAALACDDEELRVRLVAGYFFAVIGTVMLVAAALRGVTRRFCGHFGAGLTASARALLAREMRPGTRSAWPIVIMCRKMALTFIVTSLAPHGIALQLVAGLLVLVVSLATHAQTQPSSDTLMNRLGTVSLAVVAASFAAGLIVAEGRVSAGVLQTSSMAIVLANSAFALLVVAYACGCLQRKRGASRHGCGAISRCSSMLCCHSCTGRHGPVVPKPGSTAAAHQRGQHRRPRKLLTAARLDADTVASGLTDTAPASLHVAVADQLADTTQLRLAVAGSAAAVIRGAHSSSRDGERASFAATKASAATRPTNPTESS